MLLRWSLLSAMVMAWMPLPGAWAHEIRPAYLEINEITPGRYDVLWRTPVLSGRQLPIVLKFAEGTRNVTEPSLRELPDSLLERRVIELPGGLAGTRIDIVGLQATITDVLVRAQMLNGTHSTTLVHPSQPWLEIAAERGWLSVVGAYLRHGIDHILLGYDHLLFVFALMLIVRRTQALLWTITAFTLAHSITLALATLGLVHVPGPPVEARVRDRTPTARRSELDLALAMAGCVLFRIAARARIRQRTGQHRLAARRHPARAGRVQRRR